MQRMYKKGDDGKWAHMDFHPIDAREQKAFGWIDEKAYELAAGIKPDMAPSDAKEPPSTNQTGAIAGGVEKLAEKDGDSKETDPNPGPKSGRAKI